MSLLIDASARASQILVNTFETYARESLPSARLSRSHKTASSKTRAQIGCSWRQHQNNQPLELSTHARSST